MKKILWTILLGLILASSWVGIASAQQPTPSDDEVNAIARELYCPVCENTPLDVCPTDACKQWRELIRQMLAEGKTGEEIKQYFVEQYGATVLSEPPRAGINWLAYIVPPVAFLAGAYLLFRAFRSMRALAKQIVTKAGPSPSPGTGPSPRPKKRPEGSALTVDSPTSLPGLAPGMDGADDEYVARLEEELRKRQS